MGVYQDYSSKNLEQLYDDLANGIPEINRPAQHELMRRNVQSVTKALTSLTNSLEKSSRMSAFLTVVLLFLTAVIAITAVLDICMK